MAKIEILFNEETVQTTIENCDLEMVHFASAKMMAEVLSKFSDEEYDMLIESIVATAMDILDEEEDEDE